MKKKLLTLLIFGALSASLIACGKEVQLNDNLRAAAGRGGYRWGECCGDAGWSSCSGADV